MNNFIYKLKTPFDLGNLGKNLKIEEICLEFKGLKGLELRTKIKNMYMKPLIEENSIYNRMLNKEIKKEEINKTKKKDKQEQTLEDKKKDSIEHAEILCFIIKEYYPMIIHDILKFLTDNNHFIFRNTLENNNIISSEYINHILKALNVDDLQDCSLEIMKHVF